MPMKQTAALTVSTAAVLLLLAGCSTQAKKVDCDGPLKPINRPAPAAAAPSKEPVRADEKGRHEK
jgi:hypothetical protein